MGTATTDVERDTRAYQQHRALVRAIDFQEVGNRGCFGLALVVDSTTQDSWVRHGEQMFLSDKVVRWASLVDVPAGHFQLTGPPREVHWATVRPTTVRCGVPLLARGEETLKTDFRLIPGSFGAINPADRPQLFRVFVALEWAMTTTAFHHRHPWVPHREHLLRALNVPKEDAAEPIYLFGGDAYSTIQRPSDWMPRAYVGFPEDRRDWLFDRTTRHPGWEEPAYPEGMRRAFVASLADRLRHAAPFAGRVTGVRPVVYRGVNALRVELTGERGEVDVSLFSRGAEVRRRGETLAYGDTVGLEPHGLPAAASDKPGLVWKAVTKTVGARNVDDLMRLWFDRHVVELEPGLVHGCGRSRRPRSITATTATRSCSRPSTRVGGTTWSGVWWVRSPTT
jgi:hypothetical protein